jgi:FixJ family two-component response regulator
MRRLRQLLPKLSERDYRVALYSFAGFSNRAIAIFIDSDPVSVSKIKYNIKTKIKSVESVDVSALVAALSEK